MSTAAVDDFGPQYSTQYVLSPQQSEIHTPLVPSPPATAAEPTQQEDQGSPLTDEPRDTSPAAQDPSTTAGAALPVIEVFDDRTPVDKNADVDEEGETPSRQASTSNPQLLQAKPSIHSLRKRVSSTASHHSRDSPSGTRTPSCCSTHTAEATAPADTKQLAQEIGIGSILAEHIVEGGDIETFENHCALSFAMAPEAHRAAEADMPDGSPSSSKKTSFAANSMVRLKSEGAKQLTSALSLTNSTPFKEYVLACELDLDHQRWYERNALVTVTKLTAQEKQAAIGNSPSSFNLHFLGGGSSQPQNVGEIIFRRSLKDIAFFRRVNVKNTSKKDQTIFRFLPSHFDQWNVSYQQEHPDKPVPSHHPPYNCVGDIGLEIDFQPIEGTIDASQPKYQHFTKLRIRFPRCEDRERVFYALRAVQSSLLQDALREEDDASRLPPIDLQRTKPTQAQMSQMVSDFLDVPDGDVDGNENQQQSAKKKNTDKDGTPQPPNKGIILIQFPKKQKPRKLRARKDAASGDIYIEIIPSSAGQMWRGVPEQIFKAPSLTTIIASVGWGSSFFLERQHPDNPNKRQRVELTAKNFEDRTAWIKWFESIGCSGKDKNKEVEEQLKKEREEAERETDLGKKAFESFSKKSTVPVRRKMVSIAEEEKIKESAAAPPQQAAVPLLEALEEMEAEAMAESVRSSTARPAAASEDNESSPTTTVHHGAVAFWKDTEGSFTKEQDAVLLEASLHSPGLCRTGSKMSPRGVQSSPQSLASCGMDRYVVCRHWVVASHSSLTTPSYMQLVVTAPHTMKSRSDESLDDVDDEVDDVLDLTIRAEDITSFTTIPTDQGNSPGEIGGFVNWAMKLRLRPYATQEDRDASFSVNAEDTAEDAAQKQDLIFCSRLLQEPIIVSCTTAEEAEKMTNVIQKNLGLHS